jgi:PIN domain nuclease of toxin-antitoxin system
MTVVLDASAVIAVLKDEPGAKVVTEVLAQSIISAVNWCEVVQKMHERSIDVARLSVILEGAGLKIAVFDAADAVVAAHLWQTGSGLSLADRACLALGIKLGAPVLTADRYWTTVETGAEVQVIR